MDTPPLVSGADQDPTRPDVPHDHATKYRSRSLIPSHSHPDTYEVFYVTGGAVRVFVEDLAGEQHERLLTSGDFGFVPKNCPHAYRIERHHSVIVGVAAGPGGTFERFFEALGTPAEELGLPAAAREGSRPLELDLWLPREASGPVPVVVFVHGGAWRTGLREDLGPRFRAWSPGPFARLVRAGFAVACPDYRLSGEAVHPAQLDDLTGALAGLRLRAAELGLDADRTVLWGP
ncbi:cupin domain-containing protein [Actinoallomurus sp. NPDC052308]|uniref:cupin domain-containing protein n=1 Tax=Actinoallomurus sp. NPDC052308 TaxID=3155530 RepID=UPI00343CF496